MFSFAGDTVLDAFCGTGSTTLASINAGRNSIGNEIEPAYLKIARQLANNSARQTQMIGPEAAEVVVD
jgi:site-specific DNA-methyltransferase (adenine-specific)